MFLLTKFAYSANMLFMKDWTKLLHKVINKKTRCFSIARTVLELPETPSYQHHRRPFPAGDLEMSTTQQHGDIEHLVGLTVTKLMHGKDSSASRWGGSVGAPDGLHHSITCLFGCLMRTQDFRFSQSIRTHRLFFLSVSNQFIVSHALQPPAKVKLQ